MEKIAGSYENIWIEITKNVSNHGGRGWEFSTCLWSPSKNKSGKDYYRIMRIPQKGDLVIHIYQTKWPDNKIEFRICGYSKVREPYKEINQEPPTAGD